jgi:hypothetical protein
VDLLVCIASLGLLVIVGVILRARLQQKYARRYQRVIERGGNKAKLVRILEAQVFLAVVGLLAALAGVVIEPTWNDAPLGRFFIAALILIGVVAGLIMGRLIGSEQ